MRKKVFDKLSARSGETLAEVLIALLIVALSGMLLAVMVSTASAMDRQTRARDELFYKDLSHAETHTVEDGAPAGTGRIVIEIDGTDTSAAVDVSVYGGNGLTSYEKKAGDGP